MDTGKLPVMVIGTGLLARQVAEILNLQDFVVYGFLSLNSNEPTQELNDIPILGNIQDNTFQKLLKTERMNFIVADIETKVSERESLKITKLSGNQPISVIHHSAILSQNLRLGVGNIIHAGAIIGINSDLASFIHLGAGCVIEADCQIDSRVIISSKAVIGSGAVIEEDAFIGSGSIISPYIKIGKGAKIAPGSNVISSVSANITVFGNPATELKTKKP